MKWIKVSEKLPEKRSMVLIYGRKSYYVSCLTKGNGWAVDDDGGYFYISEDQVTHWMPLPQPPKEQE